MGSRNSPDSDPALGAVVVPADDLQRRIGELGEQITADYRGRTPLLVGVLKGAFMFMSDLARESECMDAVAWDPRATERALRHSRFRVARAVNASMALMSSPRVHEAVQEHEDSLTHLRELEARSAAARSALVERCDAYLTETLFGGGT